jgi:hypothetical protein
MNHRRPNTTWALRLVLLLCLVVPGLAGAQTDREPATESEAGKVFLLPIEFDFDSGAANGDAFIARLLPVNSLLVKDTWKLVNVALITLADAPGGVPGFPGNPDPVSGEKVFGLADFTDAILYTPTKSKGLMWGVGGLFGFPTATNDVLGSGKWSAGPAVRLGYQSGPWRLGLLVGNRWSFAGDSDRAEVNQLMARGLVRCRLGKGWFFIYAPIITANWNASSDQRWLVPLGGGIGKSFKLKQTPLNISLQAYGNALKPDGAPDSVFRIAFGIPFRVPGRP